MHFSLISSSDCFLASPLHPVLHSVSSSRTDWQLVTLLLIVTQLSASTGLNTSPLLAPQDGTEWKQNALRRRLFVGVTLGDVSLVGHCWWSTLPPCCEKLYVGPQAETAQSSDSATSLRGVPRNVCSHVLRGHWGNTSVFDPPSLPSLYLCSCPGLTLNYKGKSRQRIRNLGRNRPEHFHFLLCSQIWVLS